MKISLIAICIFSNLFALRGQDINTIVKRNPVAIIDLTNPSSLELVKGNWKTKQALISQKVFYSPGPSSTDSLHLYPTGKQLRSNYLIPTAHSKDFDDHDWNMVSPDQLSARQGNGLLSFVWYRINLTIPQKVGNLNIQDQEIYLDIVADDYSEIWVNGKQEKVIGQNGHGVISGWNASNRVLLTDHATPGDQFQVAILVTNGPLGNLPENYVWIRNATLDIYVHETNGNPLAGELIKIDNSLDQIISPDNKVVKIATGFQFTEGPVWHPDGYLLFSDPNANVIYRYEPAHGSVQVHLNKSGYTGIDIGSYHQPGSNGLAIDPEGRLIICQHGNRRISRMELKGPMTILSDQWNHNRLNSPNDLVIKSDGSIYFTDPPYGLPQAYQDPAKEQTSQGVYRIKDGVTEQLTSIVSGPNGIAFSPDEKYLYVSNWDIRDIHHTKALYRFDVSQDGMIHSGTIFFDFNNTDGDEALDGMKVDLEGNLYVSAPTGVWIINPEGKYIGKIKCEERPANMAWGDTDGKTLYMTGHSSLYKIRTNIGGKIASHKINQ